MKKKSTVGPCLCGVEGQRNWLQDSPISKKRMVDPCLLGVVVLTNLLHDSPNVKYLK